MKKLAAFICCLAVAQALCAGDLLASLDGWRLSDETTMSMGLEKYSERMGNVVSIALRPEKNAIVELYKPEGVVIAKSQEDLPGAVSFDFFCDAPEALARISIRLVDAKGEVFQMIVGKKLRPGEWSSERFFISGKTKFDSSWGKNADKKLDYPVKLRGIVFDFQPGLEKKTSLYVKKLQWSKIQ